MATYEIGGYTLNFTDDYYEYGKIKTLLTKQADIALDFYNDLYDKYGNVERLLDNGEEEISRIVLVVFNGFKQIALQRGIYDFSEKKLFNSYEYEKIIKPISEAIHDIRVQLAIINSDEENAKKERELRKATRARVVGGGFGLTGALKGMAMAGAINMGTGLLHGSVNTVGNLFTSISASSDRRSLYKDAKEYLKEALLNSLSSLLPFLCNVLNVKAGVNYSKEQAILKNILDGSFGDFDLRKPFVDAFLAYPFDDALYKSYLMAYPEEQLNIVKMSIDFGVSLDKFLEDLCMHNGFRFNTLVEVQYCIKSEEALLKQIIDLTEEEFASNLLAVNNLEQVLNPLLVLGLSKKYGENLQVPTGFEAINEYRKYILSRLQTVAAKNSYPTNISLPYAYGNLNENLIFTLGIYQAFFSTKKKLGNYSNFNKNNYYFHFENASEEIILGPCGISVKKKKSDKSYIWINPSEIKTIEFEKNILLGSTLIINDKKYNFSYIGNDMEFVVKMIKFLQRDLEWCFVYYYADAVKDANCCFGWADALEKGYFAAPDTVSAGYYYAQAALNGNVNAQNKIAGYYHSGNLVNVNYECAKYWYTKAKNGGCEQADAILNDSTWLNIPLISDEVAYQNLTHDFQIQRNNNLLVPCLQQTIVTSTANKISEQALIENTMQINNKVTDISTSENVLTNTEENHDNNVQPKRSRWVYVIGAIVALGAFNLLTDFLGNNDSSENIKPHVKHNLERKINNNIQVSNNVTLHETSMPVVTLSPREDLKNTGKKVVAKSRMVYVFPEPNENSKFIDETYFAKTYGYLGTYGEWCRIYVSDYGGAYIPAKYVSVLDDNFVIGSAVISENTDYQENANPSPKYKKGIINQNEVCDVLGYIDGNDGERWVYIKLKDGNMGFIQRKKCDVKFNTNWH